MHSWLNLILIQSLSCHRIRGNGDLVVDDLSHVHNKSDDLMAKLMALNQVAEDIPMALSC